MFGMLSLYSTFCTDKSNVCEKLDESFELDCSSSTTWLCVDKSNVVEKLDESLELDCSSSTGEGILDEEASW